MVNYSRPRGFEDGNGRLTGAPTPWILPLVRLNFLSVAYSLSRDMPEPCSLVASAPPASRDGVTAFDET